MNWHSKIKINFKNRYLFIRNRKCFDSQDFSRMTDMRHLSHLQFMDDETRTFCGMLLALLQTISRCKFLFVVQVKSKCRLSRYIYRNHQVASVLTRRVVKNLK